MQFLNCCVWLSTHTCSHTLSFVLLGHKMDGYKYFFTSSFITTLPCYERQRLANRCFTISLQYAIVVHQQNGKEWRNWEVVLLRKLCGFPPPPESSFQSVVLLSTLKSGDFRNSRINLCSQFWIKQCNWQSNDHFLNLILKTPMLVSFILFVNVKAKGLILSQSSGCVNVVYWDCVWN